MAYPSTLPAHVRLALIMIRREIAQEHYATGLTSRISAILDALDQIEHPPSAAIIPLRPDPAEPTRATIDPDEPA